MQIKTLHVDFTGAKSLSCAIEIENEHVETLRELQKAVKPIESLNELESVDDDVIAYAIQQFKDEEAHKLNHVIQNANTSTISVFLNTKFYKDFELHAEVQVVHSVSAKALEKLVAQ